MKKIIGILLFYAVILCCYSTVANAQQKNFAEESINLERAYTSAIYKHIKPHKKYGDYSIRFVKLERKEASVILIFNKGPMSIDEAKKISIDIAEIIVKKAIEVGINPIKENMFVFARVQTKTSTKSPTGANLVNVYGRAIYDPYKDIIEWKGEK